MTPHINFDLTWNHSYGKRCHAVIRYIQSTGGLTDMDVKGS